MQVEGSGAVERRTRRLRRGCPPAQLRNHAPAGRVPFVLILSGRRRGRARTWAGGSRRGRCAAASEPARPSSTSPPPPRARPPAPVDRCRTRCRGVWPKDGSRRQWRPAGAGSTMCEGGVSCRSVSPESAIPGRRSRQSVTFESFGATVTLAIPKATLNAVPGRHPCQRAAPARVHARVGCFAAGERVTGAP